MFKKITRTYRNGEIVFQQGSRCDGIYSVQRGLVSVYKTKATPQGPVEIELVQLGPGSMFGEMGMFDNTPRDASVKALEFTEVIIITKEMFESQMAALPAWIMNFIKILSGRLRATNEKLAVVMQTMETNGIKPPEEKFETPAEPSLIATDLPTHTSPAAEKPATDAPPIV